MVRLDGLRGIAALSVALFHAGAYLTPSLAADLLPGGFIGVDLFFVLSGFLMTSILLSPAQGYGRFYARRVARIFPALYLFLAAQWLYTWATHSTGSGWRTYALIGLGSGNWAPQVGSVLPFSLAQTWSLGVEEQLYLVWPVVLLLLGRRHPDRLKWLCVAGIGVSLLAKLAMFRAGMPAVHIYGQTDARLDDFLAGAFVAVLWHRNPEPARFDRFVAGLAVFACAFLGLTLAIGHPYSSAWLYEGGFTAVGLAGAVVLYACLRHAPGTAVLATRPLRALGRVSYAVYLWHPLVFLAVARAWPTDLPVRVLVGVAALITVSVLSTVYVEEPFRRLASRYLVRRARPEPVMALAPS
jgi:peptidoglycan/LPS O-acetylase OafA/YrhL